MSEIGIRQTHNNLKMKLGDYIKAQYFAENDILMSASDELLNQEGTIYREPYIEVSKSYCKLSDGFNGAAIDQQKRAILQALADHKLGVFNTPFVHQVRAVENYYSARNVIVTTGTGSGKTECFLWPILTNLIYEAQYSPVTWQKEGIRALVLYPMNALVSDQLGRLRKIIGRSDDAYNALIEGQGPRRRVRFGMYTGRTPYAGEDNPDRNRKLAKVLRTSYLESHAHAELVKIGRVPAKDLQRFVDNLAAGRQVTSNTDSELYTRLEMQKICPDILVTNYSMLEYMLMRPIEAPFWDKTRDWLNASDKNRLLLVIDEAHMYRGAAGGEVSLLIRRLTDRLGIVPEQLQCILTSASVPGKNDSDLQNFAKGLTGTDNDFAVIREEVEKQEGHRKGTQEEAQFYSSLSLENLQGDPGRQLNEIKKIALYKNLQVPQEDSVLIQNWIYKSLVQDPLFKEILFVCGKGAKRLSEIATAVFESNVVPQKAEAALEVLLQLGVMGKSPDDKVLIGSKVHMLFRGLQGLYACINPDCSHIHEAAGIRLGYITSQNIDMCPYCGSRMFELMMDRRCGATFIKGYISSTPSNIPDIDFIWANKKEMIRGLDEIHLWLMPEGRTDIFKPTVKKSKAAQNSMMGYVDSQTGFLFRDESHEGEPGYVRVLFPDVQNAEGALSFNTCPNCGRDRTNITPFRTRGNEPFANIVREQFDSQVPKDVHLKNKGKKVLLFSDSRQRAATLARDLTVESDGDAGRQALFVAQKLLDRSYEDGNDSDSTLELLYGAFVRVVYENKLSFFYGSEKEKFDEDVNKYRELFSGKPRIKYRRVRDKIGNPPAMFYQLLLRNICNSYRSYNNLYLGQVVFAETGDTGDEFNDDVLDKVSAQTGHDNSELRDIYNTWLQYLLVRMDIFPDIDDSVRNSVLSYERAGFGIDENPKLPQFLNRLLTEHGLTEQQISCIAERIVMVSSMLETEGRGHNRKYIQKSELQLKTAEDSEWYKCDRCAGASTFTLWGHCVYCGSDQHIRKVHHGYADRYALWTRPVFDAVNGKQIVNIDTEEHTAQLSYKDNSSAAFGTTEKYELAFRNVVEEGQDPIDVLSCTTTMEVGIDIGDLTSVGLRNVPPMRENYQQRAGRAGRAGAAVSSIVTYTENGPHDAWYFNHPESIISGDPRAPWIDARNEKLIRRHVNLILLEQYLRPMHQGLDEIYTIDFFSKTSLVNYEGFKNWIDNNIPLSTERTRRLIPLDHFDWDAYHKYLYDELERIYNKVQETEFIYQSVGNGPTGEDEESNSRKLIDLLFGEGFLPNYSFPRDVVNFWIQNDKGLVKESPQRSIDVSLGEYAPGRRLVINKQTYISGGLFDYYTARNKEYQYNAAEPWLKLREYSRTAIYCTNAACGWFGIDTQFEECPLCGSKLEEHAMVKPWGFAPREGRNVPETQDRQEMSYASRPSYSSLPSGSKMQEVGSAGYIHIEKRNNQKLVIMNSGVENAGFQLCRKCGAIEPATSDVKLMRARKRPYQIPYRTDDTMHCNHDYSNVFLGYEFNTDLMVLEISLDGKWLDLKPPYMNWLIPALTTFAEALTLSASRVLDVEYNDMKSGYRLRTVGDHMYADVYLYDSLSSGAGYAARVSELIDQVMDQMEELLANCSCEESCPNCLENFYNQREKTKLDRYLGLHLLHFIRTGHKDMGVNESVIQRFVKDINRLAELQGHDELLSRDNDIVILHTTHGNEEIRLYPALWNKQSIDSSGLLISDRRCKYDLEQVWVEIVSRI